MGTSDATDGATTPTAVTNLGVHRTPTIAKIQRVPLREVWFDEARGFTAWLQDNLDLLGEITELSLSDPHREAAVGELSLDLFAKDRNTGRLAIIENQLEQSDHDHLGKVLTYLAGLEASIAIWIVSKARPEHVKAVAWMNDSVADVDFYLLKLEAIKIEGSSPAPLLTLITGPSKTTRSIRQTKRELTEDEEKCRQFWTGLLEKAKGRSALFEGASPPTSHWLAKRVAQQRTIEYVVTKSRGGRVELYIERGDGSGVQIYDELFARKNDIEREFGAPLDWIRKVDQGACTVGKTTPTGGYENPDEWSALQESMVANMVRLERALTPYVNKPAGG